MIQRLGQSRMPASIEEFNKAKCMIQRLGSRAGRVSYRNQERNSCPSAPSASGLKPVGSLHSALMAGTTTVPDARATKFNWHALPGKRGFKKKLYKTISSRPEGSESAIILSALHDFTAVSSSVRNAVITAPRANRMQPSQRLSPSTAVSLPTS